MVGVQFVDECLAMFYECTGTTPAPRERSPTVRVLDHMRAAGRRPWKQESEGRDNVAHDMAAVIEDDVRGSELLDQAGQERQIGPTADPDGDSIRFELSAIAQQPREGA
jgi:hypothetical protein